MKRQALLEQIPEDDGDIGEDEKQQIRATGGINSDLMRETGGTLHSATGRPQLGSYGYDFMGGGPARGGPSSAKMALLMGFNHLNTIEEEKHETQTSNYFREAGDMSERDDSMANHTHLRGSKILDDHELNNSQGSKISPNGKPDFDF